MTFVRVVSLGGVALLVLVLNVAATFLYMVVYGHLINPGHENSFYQEHVQVAGPYCSFFAGTPLMFLAGYWVAGWWGGELGVKAALVVWLAYGMIDLGVLLAMGMTGKIAIVFTILILTKLAAVYAGALVAAHNTSQNGPLVLG